MPRWMRALVTAAAATGIAALVFRVLPRLKASDDRPKPGAPARTRSREEIIDDLSDVEKAQMLRELGQHV